MERKNRPASIPTAAALPQPSIDLTDNILTARLPSNDSVTVNLYGATVTSWKTSSGAEQLFLSTAAILDGSKPIRGGIPLVFPVFGPPPKTHVTKNLPQHGFARNNNWEFLGKSTDESLGKKADDSIKLDFGLSSGMLDEVTREKWPYDFGLVYSVTLGKGSLETSMHVQNKGDETFEFQCLFHTYLRVNDISTTSISGLQSFTYVDKVRNAQSFTEPADSDLTITSEVDRVYTTPISSDKSLPTITLLESGKPKMVITRDALPDATVWNLWDEKAKSMGDFEPKDGWKSFVAIEPGTVSGWVKLDAGDAWEGGVVMTSKL